MVAKLLLISASSSAVRAAGAGLETEAKSRAAHKPAAVALTVALTGILTLLDNLHRRVTLGLRAWRGR